MTSSSRIRVLHVIHSSAFGGGPAMVELLCRSLHGEEFKMSLISSGEGDMPNRLAHLGIRVMSLPLASKGSFTRHIPQLARLIRRESPNLVHLHGQFAGSLGQVAVQLAGRIPTVYSVQWPAYLADSGSFSRIRDWAAEGLSCRLARAVVAVSEHDRQELIRRRLCASTKLTVIYNSYDPAKFSVGANSRPQASDAPPPNGAVLGFVGRLVDQKGCEFLIRALPDVLRAHPKTRLLIVGEGPERSRLQELVQALGLGAAVQFLGYRPAPADLMRTMDVIIVPSLYDPFPVLAVEAMACGRPVIASAVGGLTEAVDDRKTGLLVPPGNATEIARAIGSLLDSPKTRADMGQAARKRAEERFGPDRSATQYADLYRLIARRA